MSASEASRGSPRLPGAWLITVAAPRIETSGVRNWCDTEPIRASRSASVSERTRASLMAWPRSRCSSVAVASRQNGIDPLPDGVGRLSRLRPKIDGQDAEIARLRGNGSNEPDVTFAVLDDAPVD